MRGAWLRRGVACGLGVLGLWACTGKSGDGGGTTTARGPFTVTAMGPAGEAQGPVQVYATFDKAVVELGDMDDRKARAFLRVTPEKPGQYRFLGTQTVVFEFTGNAPRSTLFKAEVPASTGATGTLTTEFSTQRLRLTDTSPNKGFSQAPNKPVFLLQFNQPVNPADLSRAVSFGTAPPAQPVAANCVPAPKDAAPNSYTCTATGSIPSDTAVTLTVARTLHGAEGPLEMEADETINFRTHGPSGVKGVRCDNNCAPEYGARIEFQTPLIPNKAKGFVDITPTLTLDVDGDYPTQALYLGGLKPSTSYTVRVKKGLKDEFDQELTEDKTFTFQTSSATPAASLPARFITMEPGRTTLPLKTINTTRAHVELWKVADGEAPVLAHTLAQYSDARPRTADKTLDLSFKSAKDQWENSTLDFASMLTNGRGLVGYRVHFPEVNRYEKAGRKVEGFVQVTPWGITLKSHGDRVLAWVTQLKDGAPVAQAKVTLLDVDGRSLWTGDTDEAGLCEASGLNPEVAKESWAVVRKDDDVAVGAMAFEDGLSAYDQGAFMDWRDGNLTGIVFTDRGVYRPGEPVHVKAVLRLQDAGELRTPANSTVQLTLAGPTGDNVLTRKIKLSNLGTGHVTFNLDSNAKLGSYALELAIGEQRTTSGFMVEQFRAPDFKVEVRPAKPEVMRGQPVQATATASYLFGAPLAGAAVKTTVNLVPTFFTPRNAPENFTFDDDTRWLQDSTVSSSMLLQKEETADKDGAVKIDTVAKAEVMPSPFNAVVEVTAVDPSGQSITSTGSVLVHPAAFYLGLRTADVMVKAGESFNVEAVALNPDGGGVSTGAAAILRRREYKAVQQQALGDSTQALNTAEDKEVARCALDGLGKDIKSCALKATQPGLHLLSLEGKDSNGNPVKAARVLWVFGPGEAPWLAEETLAVKMVTDKKTYRVGDVARVLVQNPFPGARALVTVERGTVSQRKTVVLEGNAPTLEVPITDAFIPNMFVGVVIIRGRVGAGAKDGPAVRAGYAQLTVDPGTRRLAVKVTPNAAEYGPRDKVTVSVDLKDAAGAAAAGEVALFVVDESVLQLTGFKTPDPIPTFYAPRGINVHTADSRIHLVDMRSYGEKGEDEGGGGLGALLGDEAVRGRFLTCAYFNPAIKVPASGTAEVSFELPDNLTGFRLMALAVGDGHRFGSAENSLRVKKPLMLRPARPRLVRVGDEASVGVVAVNATGAAGQVEFLAENRTPELADLAALKGTVTAENGASVPWRVNLKAKKAGTVVLRVAGKLGSGTDSVEMKIPVAEPMPLLHDATYGAVEDGKPATVPLAAPKDVRPNMGGLTVTLATTLLSGLSNAAMQLRSYPYDCAEQTASKLLPYVELGSMRDAFGITNAAEFDALSSAAVNKLLSYQGENGGFSFWPGGQPNAWLTAYAALVLSRAQSAGFKIPSTALHRGQGFLKENVNRWDGRQTTPGLDQDTVALVVDVLATLKDPVPAVATRLYEARQTLRAESKALLLHALALNGSARDVKPLADEMAALVHQSPSGATIQLAADQHGWLGSSTRAHALVLRALVATGTHNALAEKLAVGLLAAQVKGSYRTTQEAAWALLAVREYQQVFEKEPPNLTGTATVGGKEVVTATFDKPSLATVVGTMPLSDVAGGGLTVNAKGKGTLRYGATFSYAPATMPAKPLERGMYVERRLLLNRQAVASNVAVGQLLHMVVEVSTPMDRNNVVADIPVPAGMELVNARLATSETVPSVVEHDTPALAGMEGEDGEMIPESSGDPLLQGYFDHVELRDDRLLLFATTLPRGVHRYVVGVRSVTPGRYVLPPARVEEMYTPEVFGQGAGLTFTVGEGGKP